MNFRTDNLVEAALMFMRTQKEPKCEFDARHHCTFVFEEMTDEDVAYARSDALVKARAFNFNLVQIKTIMYSNKGG